MVIGVEEPILIKGVGEMLAKIDSGNSGYNVIHGEDLIVQGDIITFKTFNKDGVERRVSKKIKDTININIGGGHIQERPVVELNVKFGGEDYKKVPFSITNRSGNEHQVLISKDFVGKELDALIDVSKNNISNNNISVDYVSEGVLNSISQGIQGISQKTSKAIGTFTNGTEAGKTKADLMAARRKAMWGEGGSPESRGQLDQKLVDEVDALSNLAKQLKADKELIKNQLKTQQEKLNGANADNNENRNQLNVPVEKNNIEVYKIIDYTGGTYDGQKNANDEFKKRLKEALAAYKLFKGQSEVAKAQEKAKTEAEEVVVENTSIPSATPSATPTQSTAPANSSSTDNTQTQNNNSGNTDSSPAGDIQGTEEQKNISNMSEAEVEEVLKELQARNRAIFYMVCFKMDNNQRQLKLGADVIKACDKKISSWVTKIGQGKDWSVNVFKNVAQDIANDVQEDAKGFFALCTGDANARKVEYLVEPGKYNGAAQVDEANNNQQAAIDLYNEANNKFKELTGKELDENTYLSYTASILIPFYNNVLDFIKNSAAFRNYLRNSIGVTDDIINNPEKITKDILDKVEITQPQVRYQG